MISPILKLASTILLLLASPDLALGMQQALPALPRPPEAGRVLWLRADRNVETALGNTVTSWAPFDDGPLELGPWIASGQPLHDGFGAGGKATLRFDGDDLLVRPDGMPTGSYTKIAVVLLEDYASNNNVFSGASEHAIFYGHTDRAQVYHSGTFVTSSIPTPLHEPTILVATFDSTTGEGRLYQNGALVGTGNAAPHADPALQLGAFASGNNLRGAISEVLLYDRVLTSLERNRIDQLLDARYRTAIPPTVQFTRIPRHAQVLQRDNLDRASVKVEGVVETPGYDSIVLRVQRDGAPWSTAHRPLVYGASGAPFAFDEEVVAGLHDHEVTVILVAGSLRRSVRRIDAVTCGDTLLLNGQSNTVARDYWNEGLANQSQSHWIRSFGSAVVGSSLIFDLNWCLADGEGSYEHGTIGAWGLRAAELIVQEEQVPLGLINGSVGGTEISLHLRNDANPTDTATIYGRLLYRARAAELATTARAMLWYQGESDGEEVAAYTTRFATLHAAWMQDYPALEKTYLFQTRKGCGVNYAGVREFLRTAPDLYPDLEVMSTTAAPQHDGCHYYYAGYRELGDRIARLLLRDLHGSSDTQEIDPPNIASANLVAPSNDTILLTFRDPDDTLVWESGSGAYFLLNDSVSVLSGSATGNTILLQLSGPTTATLISYDGHIGDGPWVSNTRGVGALTFFDFPITP
jgi:hypothetical protein